ncbi:Putative surface protein bspA-like (TvBspA-like-625) [Durusdinium trenchii]|uniref:Surface protein bspA-like (TvBspA-like-625) n=1 Tax=Durusdinium trenchii TaxID=1381693 RepID=A0ABP0RZ23_9DINO
MAMDVPVRLMSGKVSILEIGPEMTIGEVKQLLKAELHPSDDDFVRRLSTVEVLLEGKKLDDDTETAKSAGVSPTSEVRVLFTSMTRECTSRKEAGCDVSDLLDVSIPDNVTVIGSGAFESSGSLIRVTIPGSVTRIGTCAFKSCTSLSCVALPEALTEIGGYAFIGCSSLEHVRIPRKVTRIGEGAFAGCASLTILTIPDSVTEIGEGAFARCSSLKHVVIPKP